MHILLTGGGTGGHLTPLIAVGRELRKLGEEEGVKTKLYFMGPTDFGRDLLEIEKIHITGINAAKWRRYASIANFTDLMKAPFSLLQALWKMYWIMPDAIFSKGGYGAIPALIASRVYRIPVMIHESDSLPGLANRYSAKFAKRIFIAFDGAARFFPKDKVMKLGNPVRKELAAMGREDGRKLLNLRFSKQVLFITGGSQGALKINDIIINTLPHLLERYEIIHQCGEAHMDELKAIAEKEYKPELLMGYHIYGNMHEDEQAAALGSSDLVVSRAGATSIFEIAQSGKPSIIIPLSSSAGNHQFENANEYAKSGSCVVLDEQNLTPNLFIGVVSELAQNAEKMLAMSEAALRFARPNAAADIAQEIFDYVKRR
jgi:UDP-N-acetylglucosamine--N-acetylmuramyl-(pentapeptide) pyrophosphoryl-undecaprenol N-acetylglucosamine transferase